MAATGDPWTPPEHPVTKGDLQKLLDTGVFAADDEVSLNPDGIVVDGSTESPYRFSGAQVASAQREGVLVPRGIPHQYDEYFDACGRPQLADTVVCELDILGTGAETGEKDVLANLRTSRKAYARANRWTTKGVEVEARWFSDNAALFALATGWRHPLALPGVVLVSALMQLDLALRGRFCRGGIAYGPFHASDLFVYGRPLVDAYMLESKAAIYPRILLSTSLAESLLEHLDPASFLPELTAQDHDGNTFVNYLGVLNDEQTSFDPEQTLRDHRDVIRTELSEGHRQDVTMKYRWAADYHDQFCERSFPSLDVRVC